MTVYPLAKICDRTKKTMGKDTTIGDFSFICPAELVMEDGSMIARFVEVSGRGKVTLKEGAVIESHCSVLTSTDRTDAKMNDASPEEERNILTADVTIGKYAFVGNHCVIMPGVNIGDWAVVGANSYIDKDVPPNTVIRPKQEMLSRSRVLRPDIDTENRCWKISEKCTREMKTEDGKVGNKYVEVGLEEVKPEPSKKVAVRFIPTEAEIERFPHLKFAREHWRMGPYLIAVNWVDDFIHVKIRREDDAPIRDWMTLQMIKDLVLGENAVAVEVFPPKDQLVNGSNTYHLWTWPGMKDVLPNLKEMPRYH